ncbi:hypothetical protein WAI453_008543 [Rhynchosporium graminicola]|uniref:Uncharacterized protein n=1 Tax=Rhynchosporium graminicola TaxID=2792576 RepID=A0A1E1KH69_9HELO|nr:uncharacterized protein RCO7_00296 [Rhynchosporium commune]
MTAPKPTLAPEPGKTVATIKIDGNEYPVLDIRSNGDVLLDVQFLNDSDCTKSIPKDALRSLRTKKLPITSPRVLYRVKLDTIKKYSEYFKILLKAQFAEGLEVAQVLAGLQASNQDVTKVEADKLPRIKIVDEDGATKTLGRELIFKDMLNIVHGSEPVTAPFNTQCITTLIILSDRYGFIAPVSRYMQKTLNAHKYPNTLDKNGEEALRQRILIQFHTDQGMRFTNATKDLILRGSMRWSDTVEVSVDYQTIWWDLPYGLEAELAFRRACVLRTIASIQDQWLQIYSSKDRQCKLGYDSSSSCDSFQLGEMIKFLTKKGLLSLVSFQAASPYDQDYSWPEAYQGDIELLIGILRQCPAYQIDSNHGHCGLRNKLLPALDFIRTCIDTGLGIRLLRSQNGGPIFESWIPGQTPNWSSVKKAVWVGNGEDDVNVAAEKLKQFEFGQGRPKMMRSSSTETVERTPRGLFTAEKWNWVTEPETNTVRLGSSFMTSVSR